MSLFFSDFLTQFFGSYAQFEASLETDDAVEEARAIYQEADKELRKSEDKSERQFLLDSWLDFERFGLIDLEEERRRKALECNL